jgi:hypothetical protein
MTSPEGVGPGSAVAPVGPGSGSAVPPIDPNKAGPNSAGSTGGGRAASAGGTLPPVASNQVEAGPIDFEGIDEALNQVNEAVAALEIVRKPYMEALEKDLAVGITDVRKEKYEAARDKADQALQSLGQEIETQIVGETDKDRPAIHPRTPQEWARADRIAAHYKGKEGGTHVDRMARQLARVVDGVKTKKEGVGDDAADYVTRPRPSESVMQRSKNQFLRLACLLNDVTRNTNVDKHTFAQLVISCGKAIGTTSNNMGICSKKDLDMLEIIVARYGKNDEIDEWIKETRRVA